MAKTGLETLRAIFREEFDDMLQLLAQQVERAASDPRGAADEVRRRLLDRIRAGGKVTAHVVEALQQMHNARKVGRAPVEERALLDDLLETMNQLMLEIGKI